MNLSRYVAVRAIAANWACQDIPLYPLRTEGLRQLQAGVGIYIACRSDMQVRYVGSAVRPGRSTGIAERICAHPAERRGQWWWFWILPLLDTTPVTIVRGIEGQVIDLLHPIENARRHRLILIPSR